MADEVLISCENISKRFCRDLRKSLWYGVRDITSDLVRREQCSPLSSSDVKLRHGEFWANQDVSFELRRGECLGLVGRNGAGKTTLLKMLNGLIKPDTGRIEMKGKVGALIALGAGFNPILTGRENIYINGSILGMSKRQIDDRFEEIVEFAELNEFIDTPVRSYSSGMQVRLGFSIAAVLMQPDVLLLDEVLAVGDMAFRFRCATRIGQLRNRCAVIFVSHNKGLVQQICTEAILLSKGSIDAAGKVSHVLGKYEESLKQYSGDPRPIEIQPPLQSMCVEVPGELAHGDSIKLGISGSSTKRIDDAILRISFYDTSDNLVAEYNSTASKQPFSIPAGQFEFDVETNSLPIATGSYNIDVQILAPDGIEQLYWASRIQSVKVTCDHWAKAPCLFG